jgi:hypothetical protein
MSLNELYNAILKIVDSKLNEFVINYSHENSQQSSCISDIVQDEDKIEFNYLGYHFCLKSEMRATQGFAFIRTYLIEYNTERYPEKKLTHWSDADIQIHPNSYIKFAKEFKGEFSPQIGYLKGDYLGRLLKIITFREQKENESITNQTEVSIG